MNKPNDFDNVQAYGEYRPLPPGGYICRIMNVEETTSQNGKAMLIISLDIAEGEHKGHYMNEYRADTRPEKKWGCRVFQLVYDDKNATNRGFKTFITSCTESNNGFQPAWGKKEVFENCFKNKLIGGVFRREEYKKSDGSGTSWVTRCCSFRSVESIRKGIDIPKDKPLANKAIGGNDSFSAAGFENITAMDEDDFPF